MAVHPRGYGEHMGSQKGNNLTAGSSPWIRGTQVVETASTGFRRFIPVDTGNTCSDN